MDANNTQKALSHKGISPITNNLIKHKCRAKYYPDSEGKLRLASVQEFSIPTFREGGFEEREILPPGYLRTLEQIAEAETRGDELQLIKLRAKLIEIEQAYYMPIPNDLEVDEPITVEQYNKIAEKDNLDRAVRRAKIAAFDLLMCNPSLNVFGTLTFDPEKLNSTSWDEVYRNTKIWLSNRVQRNGLKYILVPEHHKDGQKIHYHFIFNDAALKMSLARYPDTGRLIKKMRGGVMKQLYNIADWSYGHSSSEFITGDSSRDKVAKYIFKYMGKQYGIFSASGGSTKIGGRYFLHGGKMNLPVYKYSDDPAEFIDEALPAYKKSCRIADSIQFNEWGFI